MLNQPVRNNGEELTMSTKPFEVSKFVCTLGYENVLNVKSRMNREVHVRFCERSGGKFLWSTRLFNSVLVWCG